MFSKKAMLNFAFYVYMKKARKIRREKLQPFWLQWKLPNVYNFHLLNFFGCVLKSTSLLLYCWGKDFQKIKEDKQKWVTTSYSKTCWCFNEYLITTICIYTFKNFHDDLLSRITLTAFPFKSLKSRRFCKYST